MLFKLECPDHSSSITWELVWDTDSLAPPQIYWMRNPRIGPSNLCVTKQSSWLWCTLRRIRHTWWWIKVVSEVNWSRFKFQFCLSVVVWLEMSYIACWASLAAQTVKKLPAMQAIQVWSLGWKDSLEKGMATHSTIVTWRIPRTEEPGGLQPMGTQRVAHSWVTSTFTFFI